MQICLDTCVRLLGTNFNIKATCPLNHAMYIFLLIQVSAQLHDDRVLQKVTWFCAQCPQASLHMTRTLRLVKLA